MACTEMKNRFPRCRATDFQDSLRSCQMRTSITFLNVLGASSTEIAIGGRFLQTGRRVFNSSNNLSLRPSRRPGCEFESRRRRLTSETPTLAERPALWLVTRYLVGAGGRLSLNLAPFWDHAIQDHKSAFSLLHQNKVPIINGPPYELSHNDLSSLLLIRSRRLSAKQTALGTREWLICCRK